MVNLIKNTWTLLPHGHDYIVLVFFVLLHIRLTITLSSRFALRNPFEKPIYQLGEMHK